MANRVLVAFILCSVSTLSLAQTQELAAKPIDAKATTEAMDAGIRWLLQHQDESGGWSASLFVRHDPKGDLCTGTGKPDQDLHVTAWATFALLARGNTERLGPHHEAVEKALAWLQTQIKADDFVGAPQAANAVVAHALSILALAEGKGLSNQEPPKAVFKRLAELRLADGTWPAKLSETKGDPMATYWASLACATGAQYGVGTVDLEPTLEAMQKGELAAPTPPAVELMLRGLARHDPKTDARLVELVDSLGKQLPQWREGPDAARMDFLAWHIGTLGMYQAGGKDWDQWNAALQTALVAHQRTDGSHAGSWDPIDANGKQGGRVYATALNVLSLSLGQRFGRMVMK